MNAVRTLRVPLHLLALAAAAALLTAAAFLALGGAQAAVTDAQRSAQLNLSLIEDSDNIVPADSTIRLAAAITFTVNAIDSDNDGAQDDHGPFGEAIYLQSGGMFRVSRGLEWQGSERGVLTLNERATSGATGTVDDDPLTTTIDETDPGAAAVDFGKLDDENCSARTEAPLTTWTCRLVIKHGSTPQGTAVTVDDNDNAILIPDGTPDGPFTIAAAIKIDDAAGNGSDADAVTLTDNLTVTVGKVIEVQTATLDFATQTPDSLTLNGRAGDPWPNIVTLAAGETRLQLSLLNSAGAASARNSVSQLELNTTFGRLSSVTLGNDACQGGDRQRVCVVDVSKLNANNSDRIIMRLEPPLVQNAGTAVVRGTLQTTDGRTFSVGPLRIRITGPAVALDIDKSASPLALLNAETADDDRDELLISVGATDARGDQVPVPRSEGGMPFSAKLTPPDNQPIPTRTVPFRAGLTRSVTFNAISVEWPLLRSDPAEAALALPLLDAEGRPQVKITSRAAPEKPLPTGTYTLELSVGGLKQSVEFTVTSPTAAIAVESDADEIGLGGQVTLTATLTTAEGEPVVDGTPVTFTQRSFSESVARGQCDATGCRMVAEANPAATAPLVMNEQATQRTKNGQATVTLRAVAPGRAYITAAVDSVTGVRTISVATFSATADTSLLSSTTANQYSVWLGPLPVRASQLLPQLTGVAALHKWTGQTWLTHTTADPATDFIIDPGNTLWLSAE